MNRRALAIAAGVLVVVVALWYFALWHPRSQALASAKARRVAAEGQQVTLRASIERLKQARKNEPLLRAKLEKLRTAIPDDPNLAQFILDVNTAAVKAGIDFVSIAPALPTAPTAPAAAATTATTSATAAATTPVAAAPAALPPQIVVSLQITGGYFQTIDFLNRLADLPRLVVFDTVGVTADSRPQPTLTVTIASRMFVRAVPAGFAPAGTPGAVTTTTAPSGGTTTSTTGARP